MIIKVNLEKESITAVITNVREQLGNSISKVNPYLRYMDEVQAIINKVPDTCVGVARCSIADEWDEQTGIDIARNRAIATHAKIRAKVMYQIKIFVARGIYARLNDKMIDAKQTAYDCEDMLDACTGK